MKLVKFTYTKPKELQQKESVYKALSFPENDITKFSISNKIFRLLLDKKFLLLSGQLCFLNQNNSRERTF